MKQTAVEWLVEQMIERKFFAKDAPLSYTTLEHLTNQARAMEKEQIMDAFDKGLITENVYYGYDDKKSEQYYNQTFKSE